MVHRSQHEELDLVSVEEFYKQAPSHILKSVSQNAGGGGGGGLVVLWSNEEMSVLRYCLRRRRVGRRVNTRRCCSGWNGSWRRGRGTVLQAGPWAVWVVYCEGGGGLWSCSVVMGTLVVCARLQAQKESLVKSIDALKEDIQKRQEKLDSLQPSLSSLLKVTSCNLDR